MPGIVIQWSISLKIGVNTLINSIRMSIEYIIKIKAPITDAIYLFIKHITLQLTF